MIQVKLTKHTAALAAVGVAIALTGCSSKPKLPDPGSDNGGLHGYWKPWSGATSTVGEGDYYWAVTRGQSARQRPHAPVPAEAMLNDPAPDLFSELP